MNLRLPAYQTGALTGLSYRSVAKAMSQRHRRTQEIRAPEVQLMEVGAGGFEPPQPGPKPDVLPLDNAPAVKKRRKRTAGFEPATACVAHRCSTN